ncbi:hypothetical protein IE53DRAFT_411509 [Violaceomyces palustris]|uniref:Uncharacterized protein n=1 Tax=Violaceomyces palustris TaxID=1673888 RepID=A0ACD0NUQ2_9BASI|nr:hypothetical protein IE53DRAFT_411509 [Violaceomyces palustris]
MKLIPPSTLPKPNLPLLLLLLPFLLNECISYPSKLGTGRNLQRRQPNQEEFVPLLVKLWNHSKTYRENLTLVERGEKQKCLEKRVLWRVIEGWIRHHQRVAEDAKRGVERVLGRIQRLDSEFEEELFLSSMDQYIEFKYGKTLLERFLLALAEEKSHESGSSLGEEGELDFDLNG